MIWLGKRLTPVELQNIKFGRVLRGYDPREVEDFLGQVSRDYEQLYKENTELREKIQGLEEQLARYTQLENTLQKTLVMAEKSAEEVKQAAGREAELKREEAELTARKIVGEAEALVAKKREELAELARKATAFRAEFRNLLQTYLELLTREEERVRERERQQAEAADRPEGEGGGPLPRDVEEMGKTVPLSPVASVAGRPAFPLAKGRTEREEEGSGTALAEAAATREEEGEEKAMAAARDFPPADLSEEERQALQV